MYSLCELSIKLGEFVQALEYYKEFVQLAPKDSGRYILQYKLYEAQEVSLEERIEVLEELKKRDYREKWAYELAYLYHRVGLESKCVEECNEMFLWFGEGRYVLKALELKMLHEPLSEEQQAKYEQMKGNGGSVSPDYAADQEAIKQEANKETEEEEDNEFGIQENLLASDTQEMPPKEEDEIQVKTVDVSQYNTLNLQKELAESMKEFLENNKTQNLPVDEIAEEAQKTQIYEPVTSENLIGEIQEETDAQEETEEEEPEAEEKTATLRQDTDEMQLITEEDLSGKNNSEEVFFGNTEEVNIEDVVFKLAKQNEDKSPFTPIDQKEMPVKQEEVPVTPQISKSPLSDTGVIRTFHKPSGFDNMLSQEYDGQISLVVPEKEQVEKQITGQLSIEDVMAEWERIKQENERKRMEEIRRRVHQQTDALFEDFDESTKSGLLEELEKAMVTAAMKEEKAKAASERPRVVKVADIEKQEPAAAKEKTKPAEAAEKEVLEETEEIEEIEEIPALEEEEVSTEPVPEEDTQEEDFEEEQPEAAEETLDEISNKASDEVSEEADETIEEPDASEKEEEAESKEEASEQKKPGAVREMTDSEREQFAPFIHHKRTRRQIVTTLDNISMASYTGNVIVTGEESAEATALAKVLVKEVQLSDSNFSGKVAKISGATMNKKDVGATLAKLSGGALIIEEAASMKKAATESLLKQLNQEGKGLIVLLEDTKANIASYLEKYPALSEAFNLRVDVEALDDQTLVKYAQKYAVEQEYSIDELGILALHTRIADMQTSDHEVTLGEIEELVDEAIYYADRKTPKHFFDVLFGKRYDEEDMIVLREKDFMHY